MTGSHNAAQLFHARFALLSGHAVDPARIEPWEHYRDRLDDPVAATELRALWEHAHHQQEPDAPAPGAVDDGMRAVIERWLDRAERRRAARPGSDSGWAPPEPTRLRAASEAIVMAGFLLSATRPGHRS